MAPLPQHPQKGSRVRQRYTAKQREYFLRYLIKRKIEGTTLRDIAMELRIPFGTVATIYRRHRRRNTKKIRALVEKIVKDEYTGWADK